MKYRCKKGCLQPQSKRPMWHASRRECPFEPEFGGAAPGTTPAGTPAPDSGPAPESSTPPAAAGQPPGPAKKPGVLGFGRKTATTTTRTAPSTQEVKPEWEVDEDHALSFFELLDNIIVRAIRFFDGVLGCKKFDGHVLINSSADEELVKKKMGRRLVTNVTKALGATTQEEAHGIIDSGGVLVIIGGGLFSVGSHMLEEWAPAIKKKMAARKERAKKPATDAIEEVKRAASVGGPTPS